MNLQKEKKYLGQLGEQIVAQFLENEGYMIESQNWVGQSGELDLVVWLDQTLIFVEVRSMKSMWLDRPSLAISKKKQMQVARCGDEYIRKRIKSALAYTHIRFDVVGVLWKSPKHYEIDYIENAFESPWGF